MISKLFNCSVLDVVSGKIKTNTTIIVNDGKISYVGEESGAPRAPYDLEYDCTSSFLMPGFFDLHTHISYDGTLKSHSIEVAATEDPGYRAIKAYNEAKKHLDTGFTTIRDCGSLMFEDISVRNAVNANVIPGPNIYATGKPLSITGGHGDRRTNAMSSVPSIGLISNGADEMRYNTRYLIRQGVDWIKIFGSGGVSSEGDKPDQTQYTIDELRASVSEAHAAGRKVAVHAHGKEAIANAVQAGVDTIEHGTMIAENPDLLMNMKEGNIGLIPNLCTPNFIVKRGSEVMTESAIAKATVVIDLRVQTVKLAKEAGIKIALGTDSGLAVRHDESAYEFLYLKKAGLSDLEAIQAGTISAAQILGKEAETGSLEIGKVADMVLVSKNPFEGVEYLTDHKNIKGVFRRGVLQNSCLDREGSFVKFQ